MTSGTYQNGIERPLSTERKPDDTREYVLGCPVGTWRGRLDCRVWGTATNLLLYFTDIASGEKWVLSTWHRDCYRPRKTGPSFRDETSTGDVFELLTVHTKEGRPNLIAAAKIS